MKIIAYVVGDDQVKLRLASMPDNVHYKISREMRRIVIDMANRVKSDKLSGQVLNVRTGRLRGSITYQVSDSSSGVVGVVGTNVVYARVHEYGGVVNVREHVRRIRYAFGRPLAVEQQVTVQAHKATYPERSFLRSTLRDMADEIRGRLRDAVRSAVDETNRGRL